MVAHAGHECCPGGLLMGGISMDSVLESVHALPAPCVGVGGVCGVLAVAAWCWASASTRNRDGFRLVLGVWESGAWWCVVGGLACCWVLRQQASLPGEWSLRVLPLGRGRGGACWLRGSWCFGVCPVFAVVVSWFWGAGAGVRGCCLGTV